MKKNNKNLGLLMTRGMSLYKWERVGNLEREIKPYIELSKYFNNIFIFSYGDKEEIKYTNDLPCNIKIITRPSFIHPTVYMFLLPLIHYKIFKKIEILKTNQMDGSLAGVVAKRLFSYKFIVRCGYEWFYFVKKSGKSKIKIWISKITERISYFVADHIIITSQADKIFIIENFNVDPQKISVVPNYIDTNRFKPMNLPKESGRVIFVGRLHEQKNILSLISAMSGLEARLEIIGNGDQKNLIEKEALKNNVRLNFIGSLPQNDMVTELAKSEIFVLPSLYEGNPKALLEAMSTGLACIGTNVKGIKDVISSGTDGLLVGLDILSLKNGLKSLLEDMDLRNRLGFMARQKIIRDYSLEVILIKEKYIYEKII